MVLRVRTPAHLFSGGEWRGIVQPIAPPFSMVPHSTHSTPVLDLKAGFSIVQLVQGFNVTLLVLGTVDKAPHYPVSAGASSWGGKRRDSGFFITLILDAEKV